MSFATFNISKKTVPDIIEKVRAAIAKLVANVAAYATPNPTAAIVTTSVDKLSLSYQDALPGGKDKKKLVQINKKALLALMSTLQAYIQTTSGGDAAKILLVCELKGAGAKVGLLPGPGNLRADFGAIEGEIILRWAGVPKRKMYFIQISSSPKDPTQWQNLDGGVTGKVQHSVLGLVSGQVYAFRIATISADGMGGYCAGISHMAF